MDRPLASQRSPDTAGPVRRWSRVVDVVAGGVLYTEDAERLIVAGVRWPQAPERRAEAEAFLIGLVHDRIVFYEVTGADSLGRLVAEVWVEGNHVNGALRGRGYG